MLRANFTITETGGTHSVQLQSSPDGNTWTDLGAAITLISPALHIDDSHNIEIDTSFFTVGETYYFRLTDMNGAPVSNVVTTTIRAIQDYAFGTGHIDFINAGGDSWNVYFPLTPDILQSGSGTSIQAVDWNYAFCKNGDIIIDNEGVMSVGYGESGLSHGAGVYALSAEYKSSATYAVMGIRRLVKVDAAGNILAEVRYDGISLSNIDGTSAEVTATLSCTDGVSTPQLAAITDLGTRASVALASDTTYSGYLPVDSQQLTAYYQLDRAVWSDLPEFLLDDPMAFSAFGKIYLLPVVPDGLS